MRGLEVKARSGRGVGEGEGEEGAVEGVGEEEEGLKD